MAVAILGVAGGDADPALADAVFLDVGLLDALEADADVARKNLGVVIGAAWIGGEAIGQTVGGRSVGIGHSKSSI